MVGRGFGTFPAWRARVRAGRIRPSRIVQQSTINTNPKKMNHPQEIIRNGVNVTKLAGTIRALEQQPALAEFKFRARNKWDTGGHNQATIDSFYGVCQEMAHKHPFQMDADEPAILLGEDNGANPVEYVLAGLSGCMTTTLAYHAAGRGLNIESIESEFEGDINLEGLLDINPQVRPGYREIRVKFKVRGDADEATIQELVRKSPVYDTLAQPVKITVQVEKV